MSTRLAVAVLALAACVSTNAALLNPSLKLAPVCPDGVQVFTDTSKVGKPYTEVAVLNSKGGSDVTSRSEEHTSELQSQSNLVCRLLLEKKKKNKTTDAHSTSRESI